MIKAAPKFFNLGAALGFELNHLIMKVYWCKTKNEILANINTSYLPGKRIRGRYFGKSYHPLR